MDGVLQVRTDYFMQQKRRNYLVIKMIIANQSKWSRLGVERDRTKEGYTQGSCQSSIRLDSRGRHNRFFPKVSLSEQ